MDHKKQCVSVRLKPKDVEKIDYIAKRLGVRNSDVIRYAIKSTLTQLINLQNPECRGYRLLPTFIQNANELNHHLDLDTDRLEEIFNEGVPEEEKLSRSDIELVAMCGLPPHHLQLRIEELLGTSADLDELPFIVEEYLINKYSSRLSRENHEPISQKSH